jgi:hypothetical protein
VLILTRDIFGESRSDLTTKKVRKSASNQCKCEFFSYRISPGVKLITAC